jgi:hypothetical protein
MVRDVAGSVCDLAGLNAVMIMLFRRHERQRPRDHRARAWLAASLTFARALEHPREIKRERPVYHRRCKAQVRRRGRSQR